MASRAASNDSAKGTSSEELTGGRSDFFRFDSFLESLDEVWTSSKASSNT